MTTTTIDLDRQRAEFEATEDKARLARAWGFGESADDYADPYVQARWVGWQRALARRSNAGEAAALPTPWRERLFEAQPDARDYLAHVQHELGAKYKDAEIAELRAALATQQAARAQHEPVAQLQRMRAAFHTNMLRAYPDKTHEEIAAEIDKAIGAAPVAQQSEAGEQRMRQESNAALQKDMARLREILESEYACYATHAGLIPWAINALLDNSPHKLVAGRESAAPGAQQDALEQLIAENRIAVTPEYEGGFLAQVYRDSDVPQAKGYGPTPRAAVDSALTEKCSYPECNCPFDAPSDPNWCARGLQKGAQHG